MGDGAVLGRAAARAAPAAACAARRAPRVVRCAAVALLLLLAPVAGQMAGWECHPSLGYLRTTGASEADSDNCDAVRDALKTKFGTSDISCVRGAPAAAGRAWEQQQGGRRRAAAGWYSASTR